MSEQQWGVGNCRDEKAFQTIQIGNEPYELIFGEHPHSRQDNTIYARSNNGAIYGFDGHRLCFKIDVEEFNYLKSSNMSGDEIRKSCKGKLWVNGILCFEANGRKQEDAYYRIQEFIRNMEEQWDWYPHNPDKQIGKKVGYREQLFIIERVIVEQGCMMLKTPDGEPRKRFLYEGDEDFENENSIKVEITDDNICWYPKLAGENEAE